LAGCAIPPNPLECLENSKNLLKEDNVHEPFVIVSGNGRLITAQNPESATNVGEKVVEIQREGNLHESMIQQSGRGQLIGSRMC